MKTPYGKVYFSKEGFPIFKKFAKDKVVLKDLTGNTAADIRKANRAMNYSHTPPGFTWHHVEDGRTMLLIPTKVHNAVRHTGGAALLRKGLIK